VVDCGLSLGPEREVAVGVKRVDPHLPDVEFEDVGVDPQRFIAKWVGRREGPDK
jgi:hypothetical protein